LETLYEAALEPELLPQALQSYARAFNSTGAIMLSVLDHQGRTIVSPDLKDAAESYAAEWWKHDFLTIRGAERQARGMVTDLQLTTEEERAFHPFYQEFGRQFGCFWLCSQVVHRVGGAPLSISVRRPEEAGTRRELSILQPNSPMRQAAPPRSPKP
jgi:hypothetical protein